MNKKIFVVSDTSREYTERFIRCLEAWEGSRFEIRGFTEKECLSEQLAARPADILLISEAMLGMDPEFRGQLEASSRRMLVLSEQSGGGGEEHFVYRYQPLDRILRQIAAYCEEQEPWEEDAALHAEIYGVYSPVKRCYKTTFSLILGQILADRGTTLYVNLEDCSGLEALAGASGEETLSDVLYCHRVAQPKRKLRSVVQNLGKLAYLPPAVCPGDIRETDPEEMAQVIFEIGSSDAYESLVIDLGDALRDPLPVLRLCRRIYMPTRDDAVSKVRLREFQRMLSERREEELGERICPLHLPSYSRMEAESSELRELRRTPFGRYVERVIQEG